MDPILEFFELMFMIPLMNHFELNFSPLKPHKINS
jgi:hypothetical protein